MEDDILQFIEEEQERIDTQTPPKTMSELYQVLFAEGDSWREEHKTQKEDKKTGEIRTTIPPVPPRTVANILKKHVHFAVVTDYDPEVAPLCAYDLDEGIYKRGERFIGKLILKVENTTNSAARSNIMGWLEIESSEKEPTMDESLIVMNNGIFDRMERKLLPFTPEKVFLAKTSVNYNPNAKEPVFADWCFSDWLKELSDDNPDKYQLFWKIFHACLNGNYVSQKALFFFSKEGKSGKGTFQMLLRALVGKRNTAALTLKQLSAKWGCYTAYGNSLIIGDDNTGKDFIENSSNFRSIVTGDVVQAEGKGKDGFGVVITAQIVQSFNEFPKINGFDDGFKRRLVIVPFNHTYKGRDNKKVKSHYIYDKRLLEWIAYKAVNLDDVEMENTADGMEILQQFEEDNNNVLRFYNAFFGDFTSERLPVKFLFELYQAWNEEENNNRGMKQNTFTKELRNILEPRLWTYSRNSLAPLNYFHQGDLKAFNDLDYYTHYSPDRIDVKKPQPLFRRD